VKLVDTLVLGTSAVRRGGSSPLPSTNLHCQWITLLSHFYKIKMRFKFHPFFSVRNITPLLITIIFFPFVLAADFLIELYHRVCFPFYKFKYISRKKYIRIDRQRLSYLNWFEKFGCAYCGYVNGLAGYWVVIIGATETYWCGIRHKHVKGLVSPEHHKTFLKYGDKKAFDKFLKKEK
jgi:hypothetical protein